MKKYSLCSLVILVVSVVICRYILFDLHGMKEMPLILFIVNIFLIGIFSLVRYMRALIFSSLAYPLGFIIGFLFQKNGVDPGGGATNDLWLIWIRVFFAVVFIAIAYEYFDRRRIK